MKRVAVLITILVVACSVISASEIPLYPGAKKKDANDKNVIYTTPDKFEKVYEFYKKIGKEMPQLPKVLEGPIKMVYFGFENSKWRVQISSIKDGGTRIHEFTGYRE